MFFKTMDNNGWAYLFQEREERKRHRNAQWAAKIRQKKCNLKGITQPFAQLQRLDSVFCLKKFRFKNEVCLTKKTLIKRNLRAFSCTIFHFLDSCCEMLVFFSEEYIEGNLLCV